MSQKRKIVIKLSKEEIEQFFDTNLKDRQKELLKLRQSIDIKERLKDEVPRYLSNKEGILESAEEIFNQRFSEILLTAAISTGTEKFITNAEGKSFVECIRDAVNEKTAEEITQAFISEMSDLFSNPFDNIMTMLIGMIDYDDSDE